MIHTTRTHRNYPRDLNTALRRGTILPEQLVCMGEDQISIRHEEPPFSNAEHDSRTQAASNTTVDRSNGSS